MFRTLHLNRSRSSYSTVATPTKMLVGFVPQPSLLDDPAQNCGPRCFSGTRTSEVANQLSGKKIGRRKMGKRIFLPPIFLP